MTHTPMSRPSDRAWKYAHSEGKDYNLIIKELMAWAYDAGTQNATPSATQPYTSVGFKGE